MSFGSINRNLTADEIAKLDDLNGSSKEYANLAAFPVTGVTDDIYIAKDTGIGYSWDGSTYNPLGGAGAGTDWDDNTGTADKIPFNTALTKPTHAEGLFYYDKDEHTMVIFNDEVDVTQQLGREFYRRVRNESGATILNGKAVYQSGAEGAGEGRALIDLAQADSGTTENVIGVATHDIENNTYGYITVMGDVNDVDTSAFTAGDVLYLSPTVAGGLTTTRPSANEFIVEVATAEIINATTGRLNVNITNVGKLATGGISNTGWNSGLLVTEDSPINGTVDYSTGDYYHQGTLYSITGGNYDLSALYLASLADGQKAYVAIHVDESGIIESTLGTPVTSSTSVQFASVPEGDVCIAQVLIHRSSGVLQAIKNKVIVDCRSAADPNSVDELVKVSFNDDTQKYLQDAFTNNGNVTFTVENEGANETIKADVTNITGNAATVTTNANLTGDVTSVGNATTIAPKAVDVAMLADGTDGELITWSATGVATTVPVGTAGHVLTSNGTGAAPTFQAAAGGGGGAYTDKWESTFTNSSSGVWQVRTVTGATANTKVDIFVDGNNITAGIRQVGSTLDRYMAVRGGEIITTTTNSSGQIEVKSSDWTTVTFRLIGEHI